MRGRPTRTIVTGAAGFIGSHLSEALVAAGHDVLGIDSFSDSYPDEAKQSNLARLLREPRFRLVRGDLVELTLEPLLEAASIVFHCAARAGVRSSWGREFAPYAHDNILATQRLLDASRATPLDRFVYASSSSVYGEARDLPISEDSPTSPISPYGVTKLAAEQIGFAYRRAYDIPLVSLRLFTVYGSRQRPDMAFHRFISSALSGTALEVYGDGNQTRDFTHVKDVVSAMLAAAEADGVVGEAINVGGGSRVSLREVVDLLRSTVGSDPDVRSLPRAPGDALHTHASIEKARRLLGYNPSVRLSEGLREEIDWVRALTVRSA